MPFPSQWKNIIRNYNKHWLSCIIRVIGCCNVIAALKYFDIYFLSKCWLSVIKLFRFIMNQVNWHIFHAFVWNQHPPVNPVVNSITIFIPFTYRLGTIFLPTVLCFQSFEIPTGSEHNWFRNFPWAAILKLSNWKNLDLKLIMI